MLGPVGVPGVLQGVRQAGPLLKAGVSGLGDTPASDSGIQVDLPAVDGAGSTGFRARGIWVPSSNSACAELGKLQGWHKQE